MSTDSPSAGVNSDTGTDGCRTREVGVCGSGGGLPPLHPPTTALGQTVRRLQAGGHEELLDGEKEPSEMGTSQVRVGQCVLSKSLVKDVSVENKHDICCYGVCDWKC